MRNHEIGAGERRSALPRIGASSPSYKDHEMRNPPNVHVFVSADGQRIALSTLPDGGNLPSLTDSERWLPLALIPMTSDSLRTYVTDVRAATASLAAEGFHVVQIGARVIPFPQPHRGST